MPDLLIAEQLLQNEHLQLSGIAGKPLDKVRLLHPSCPLPLAAWHVYTRRPNHLLERYPMEYPNPSKPCQTPCNHDGVKTTRRVRLAPLTFHRKSNSFCKE